MKKYQDALRASIQDQLESWRNMTDGTVPYEDLYRFLHTVKGTSGTIGMTAVSDTARSLMEELSRYGGRPLTVRELQGLLSPLVRDIGGGPEDDAARHADVAAGVPGDPWTDDRPVVLLVDDDAGFLACLKDELEIRGYLALAAASTERAVASLHAFAPDSLVLNIGMADGSGADLILALRHTLDSRYIPTLVLSEDERTTARVQAYRLGADHVLRLPLELPELLAVLERQLQRKRLFDRQLPHDGMTGALKASRLQEAVEQAVRESETGGEPLAIAMLDIDGLGAINRSYGPQTGDLVLAAAVEQLREALPRAGAIVRVGGGTFLLLLPGVREPQAAGMLEESIRAFTAIEFDSAGAAFRASWSAGVAAVSRSADTVPQLLRKARKALRTAKAAGGACVAAASGTDEANASGTTAERLAIVAGDPDLCSLLAEMAAAVYSEGNRPDIRLFHDGESVLADDWLNSDERCLVILDHRLPDRDGTDVLARIRAMKGPDRCPVLLLLGRDGDGDAAGALRSGADDYARRPFDVRRLEAKLRLLAGQARMG